MKSRNSSQPVECFKGKYQNSSLGLKKKKNFSHAVCPLYKMNLIGSFFFFLRLKKRVFICLCQKAIAPHSSTLAWKIPWTEEPGRLQSMGSLELDTTERLHFHFHFPALEKNMASHSSVLAWRIPGTGEPGGLPSMGSHRVGHD